MRALSHCFDRLSGLGIRQSAVDHGRILLKRNGTVHSFEARSRAYENALNGPGFRHKMLEWKLRIRPLSNPICATRPPNLRAISACARVAHPKLHNEIRHLFPWPREWLFPIPVRFCSFTAISARALWLARSSHRCSRRSQPAPQPALENLSAKQRDATRAFDENDVARLYRAEIDNRQPRRQSRAKAGWRPLRRSNDPATSTASSAFNAI